MHFSFHRVELCALHTAVFVCIGKKERKEERAISRELKRKSFEIDTNYGFFTFYQAQLHHRHRVMSK